MPSAQKFWLVLSDSFNAPAVAMKRCTSKQAAIEEAERSALSFPGEPVFILEPVAARIASSPTVHTVELRPLADDDDACFEEG